MSRFSLGSLALLVTFAMSPAACRAEEDEGPIQVVLSPMSAPDPVLKYRLWPNFLDRIPGNAAVYYGKVKAEQNRFFGDREMLERMERWQRATLEQLRTEDAQVSLSLKYLRYGAQCTYCDWQILNGREPYYETILPEVQESRSFSRILGAAARIHIAHGRYPEAAETMQCNYALARNVAHAEFIVSGLVGIAIAEIGNAQLLEFIQQPDAPNMYWSIAELPHPLVDLRPAIRAELSALELLVPEVRDPLRENYSKQYWSDVLTNLWTLLRRYSNEPQWANSNEALVLVAAAAYPGAKRRLAAAGLDERRVAAMPVAQVLIADAHAIHERVSNLCEAAYELPYPQFERIVREAEEQIRRELIDSQSPVWIAMEITRPWIGGARGAQIRVERGLAVLRILEAVRMHATTNGGRLPETLDEVAIVPIPDDPVTEQPFMWSVRGEIAELSGPTLDGRSCRYEIRIRASK